LDEIENAAGVFGAGSGSITAEIKELASLATHAESEAARVAACREILDRPYGKAMQPIQGTMEYGVSEQLTKLFKQNTGNTLGAEMQAVRRIRMEQMARSRTDMAHGRIPCSLRSPLLRPKRGSRFRHG
jgi:hypothetical protein